MKNMKAVNDKLTLDRPVIYEIKVPSLLDENWSDWNGGMTVSVKRGKDGQTITTLTGAVDQAALHGVLRKLYSLGLPILSVICLEV